MSRSETSTGMSMTLAWYREGGAIMHLILAVLIIGLALIAERSYVILVRAKNNGRQFIERVIQLVRSGKVDQAIKQCAASKAALADMGLLILRSRGHDQTDLENVAEAAILTVVPKLTSRLEYLPMLARVALLLGGVGLTIHLRAALADFGGAPASAPDRVSRLALESAAALTPIIFALGTATVLVAARAYLVSQADVITQYVREFSARLINVLIDRPDVRLGHR